MVTEPTKPRWQLTRTPATGFWLGGAWIFVAALRWWPPGPDGRLGATTACLVTLLGLAYLASSVAVLRRRRAASADAVTHD